MMAQEHEQRITYYRIDTYTDCTPAIYGMHMTHQESGEMHVAVDVAGAPIQSPSAMLLHAYATAMGWQRETALIEAPNVAPRKRKRAGDSDSRPD